MPASSSPAHSRRILPLLARFLPPLGIAVMAIAGLHALVIWNGTRGQLPAQATVTRNTATQAPDGSVTYTSHLTFRLPTGAIATFSDPAISNDPDAPDLSTGQIVPILYPPANPAAARIAIPTRLYFTPIVVAVLAILLIDTGLIARLILRFQTQPPPLTTP